MREPLDMGEAAALLSEALQELQAAALCWANVKKTKYGSAARTKAIRARARRRLDSACTEYHEILCVCRALAR